MTNTATIPAPLSYADEPQTETVEIRRDGEYITSVYRGSALLAWFHQNCPMSMHWALTEEGYSIHEQPERFVVFYEDAEGIEHWDVKKSRLAAKRAYLAFGRTPESYSAKSYGWRVEKLVNGEWVSL